MISLKGGDIMDWGILFSWLEQKSGVSYDLDEDISEIDEYTAFIDTFFWQTKIIFIIEDLESAIETIDEYSDELTDDLPSKEKLQKNIVNEYIRKLRNNINNVKKQIGMCETPIDDIEDVLTNAGALYELISTLKSFNIDDLKSREWFEKYDEATDNVLTENLQLHSNDLIDIHQNIETIIESMIDDEDEDEDDELDADLEEDV